ncbi:hypothetical protein GQ53DRAFT_826094 [Thozetella sp. PMI_491]|nr:hypothetical protein GQ53DRAFT_826094 [Thozetella sp. PMI_491]
MKLAAVVLPVIGLVTSANAGKPWVTTTTEVVTAYTTYCPSPTTWAYKNHTYTVTKPTTITITNCPCTLSVYTPPPYTTTIPCNTTSKPYGNVTYPPTTSIVTPPPTTYLPVTTPPVNTPPVNTPPVNTPPASTSKSSSSSKPATATSPFVTANVGAQVAPGVGAVALLGAMAAYLL